MASEKTKEQRYEDLVNAVAGGELKMVKFLWNLLSEIDEKVLSTCAKIADERYKNVDTLLAKLRANPPKDGKTPSKEELMALIKPLIPPPEKAKDGKTPTKKELLALIEPLIPEMPVAIPGKPGKDGKPGVGRIPRHEWRGTFIRFEQPDGEFGPWVNLQGAPSESIQYGGSMPSVTVVQGANRFEGVAKIVLDENLTATRTPNGVVISAPSGGGMTELTPVESPDGIITEFTFTQKPKFIVTEISNFVEGAGFGFTWSGSEATLPIAPSTFVRGYV